MTSSTYKITDYRRKKPVTVRSYQRGGTTKAFAWKALLRQSIITGLTAVIVVSSYVSTYEAGKVSMFSSSDWDNITDLSLSSIDKIFPIPFTTHAEAKVDMSTPVVKDGKTQSLGSICAQAIKDHKTANVPMTGDLAMYCE